MTSTTSPSVSVLIPTHNRSERLPTLLDALEAEPEAEIIVVVNGTPDGSMELLEERAHRDRRLISVFVPTPGKAAALQSGAERATCEVILMLDDDVVPVPGLVEGHARQHGSHAGSVVIGYMPVDLPSPRRPGQFPLDLYQRSYERVCEEYERDPDSILRGLWGGNVSLRRADLLRVGLEPSDAMPAGYWYHQDRDFGLRCENAGLKGVFDRRLLARHDYRTTPAAFLRVARDSGHTRWAVHASHRETTGPLPADFYGRGVPRPGRLLVRLSRNERARRPIRLLLQGLTRVAGRLHAFRLESHAGFLLGTIEQQRGAQEAAASEPATEGNGA
jgi:glycosyltransferase involved in cell wall biosynthesis